MSFKKLEPQPGPRDLALAWEELGDGLYPGEVALRLDSGHFVAVNVEPKRIETGEGMALIACARWIDAKGRTRLDSHGQHVEGVLAHTAIALEISRLGLGDIQREMMFCVLGEPPTLIEVPVDPDAPPLPEIAIDEEDWKRNPSMRPPLTTSGDPASASAPMIPWADDVRLNASIRHAIELAGASPVPDAAAALGL